MPPSTKPRPETRLYDEEAEGLLSSDQFPDRVSLLPTTAAKLAPGQRLRILWGRTSSAISWMAATAP
jgi:hypothetical protein